MTRLAEIPGLHGYWAGDDGSLWTIWKERKRHDGASPPVMLDERRAMRLDRHTNGYVTVTIRKRHYVHRLVLEAFVGPCPPGMECRHIDGDRGNNRLDNLRWDTHLNNMADRKRHGTNRGGVMRGSDHGAAVLDEAGVRQIRALSKSGWSQRALGRRFGVSKTHISRVLAGTSWAHLVD